MGLGQGLCWILQEKARAQHFEVHPYFVVESSMRAAFANGRVLCPYHRPRPSMVEVPGEVVCFHSEHQGRHEHAYYGRTWNQDRFVAVAHPMNNSRFHPFESEPNHLNHLFDCRVQSQQCLQ